MEVGLFYWSYPHNYYLLQSEHTLLKKGVHPSPTPPQVWRNPNLPRCFTSINEMIGGGLNLVNLWEISLINPFHKASYDLDLSPKQMQIDHEGDGECLGNVLK